MYLEEKLDDMQQQLKQLTQFMMMMLPDLRSKKDVMHFLKISYPTMQKYMEEGRLKDGVHFIKDENGNIEFIPEQIMAFRAKGMGKRTSKNKAEVANKVLSDMGISV